MIDPESFNHILENLNIASVVVNYILSFVLGYFFLEFFTDKKRSALAGSAAYHAILAFWALMPGDPNIAIRYVFILTTVIACFLGMYALERSRPHQKVVAALMLYTIRGLSVLICTEIIGPVDDLVFSTPELNRIEWLVPEYVGLLVLEHTVFALYALLLIKLYHKGYKDAAYEPNVIDMLILSLPALSRMVSYKIYIESYETYGDLFNILAELEDTETLMTLSWNSYTRIFDVIVSSAFLLAVVFLFQRSRKLMMEKADEEILMMQLSETRERIEKIETLYRDMRSLKHDLRHEIRLLNELVSSGHIDDAKAGLDRLRSEMTESLPDIVTGHPVTDVLLSDYRKESHDAGIGFECDFSYSSDSGIDVFDISMVLSNAISNAISASAPLRDPRISVSGLPKQNMFLITVKNTWYGELPAALLSPASERSAAKGNVMAKGLHGYGIPNIRRIARQYYGDISYEKYGDMIVLTVMLQMNGNK